MRQLLTALLSLITVICYGQDYSIKSSHSQTIKADDINFLAIVCYCKNGVEIMQISTQEIEINVRGKLKSKGYHGEQEIPEEIAEETLSFKSVKKNDTLSLISKEWTHIHHSYLIDKLSITIPLELKFEVLNIDGNDLERRKIE